jgi:ArsR family transcriptional regulator
MRNNPQASLSNSADLFKALGHPIRLLIIKLIQVKPRHGEELAAILSLTPATISHHLTLLSGAGLLNSTKDQYYQTFSLALGVLEKTLAQCVDFNQLGLTENVAVDAYKDKVLRTFFQHGRLTAIPAQMKKRAIILEKIAQEFDPEREYSEPEVNKILVEFHDDVASLRRGLVEHHFLTRESGIYRRTTTEG